MAYAADKEPTGLTAKVTPVDADVIVIGDSADASEVAKKTTWANVKATLKTYFDTLYQASGSYLTSSNIVATITNGVTTNAPSEDAVFDALALKAPLASPTFTGTVVLPNSQALVTPVLGTPTSGTLTNCTGLPVNGIVDDTTSALGVGTLELGHASDTTLSRSAAGVLAVEGVNVLTTATGLPLSGGTMTGNVTLGENTSIALDPAGSADGKYTGITVAGTAGATLAFGDLCYLDPTDSRWELADANAVAAADGDARGILGICVLAAAGDASATTMLLHGIVRADTAFPALTIGAPVYVSETAGDIVVTQPTTTDVVIRIVGIAVTADEIFFNPDNTWTTHT